MAARGLVHGPLGENCLHLCVDMQRLFALGGPWAVPWTEEVLPAIEELTAKHPERTLFTRFIPAARPGEGRGTWARYYRRWANVTLAQIDVGLIDLVPQLARFVPPARQLDKHVYSPWTEGQLDALLNGTGVDTLVITGGETDVCVLAMRSEAEMKSAYGTMSETDRTRLKSACASNSNPKHTDFCKSINAM